MSSTASSLTDTNPWDNNQYESSSVGSSRTIIKSSSSSAADTSIENYIQFTNETAENFKNERPGRYSINPFKAILSNTRSILSISTTESIMEQDVPAVVVSNLPCDNNDDDVLSINTPELHQERALKDSSTSSSSSSLSFNPSVVNSSILMNASLLPYINHAYNRHNSNMLANGDDLSLENDINDDDDDVSLLQHDRSTFERIGNLLATEVAMPFTSEKNVVPSATTAADAADEAEGVKVETDYHHNKTNKRLMVQAAMMVASAVVFACLLSSMTQSEEGEEALSPESNTLSSTTNDTQKECPFNILVNQLGIVGPHLSTTHDDNHAITTTGETFFFSYY